MFRAASVTWRDSRFWIYADGCTATNCCPAGPEAVFRGDGDFATRTMLDNSVSSHGTHNWTARVCQLHGRIADGAPVDILLQHDGS